MPLYTKNKKIYGLVVALSIIFKIFVIFSKKSYSLVAYITLDAS